MNTVIRHVAAFAALAVTGLASAGETAASTLSWDCARAGAPGLGEDLRLAAALAQTALLESDSKPATK